MSFCRRRCGCCCRCCCCGHSRCMRYSSATPERLGRQVRGGAGGGRREQAVGAATNDGTPKVRNLHRHDAALGQMHQHVIGFNVHVCHSNAMEVQQPRSDVPSNNAQRCQVQPALRHESQQVASAGLQGQCMAAAELKRWGNDRNNIFLVTAVLACVQQVGLRKGETHEEGARNQEDVSWVPHCRSGEPGTQSFRVLQGYGLRRLQGVVRLTTLRSAVVCESSAASIFRATGSPDSRANSTLQWPPWPSSLWPKERERERERREGR